MKKILIVLLSVLSLYIFNKDVEAKNNVTMVPTELEELAIEELKSNYQHLNLKSENFELKFVRELYHTDDTIIGYYTNIYEGERLVGFALISANESLGTLLEWGPLENGADTHYGEILGSNLNQNAYYLSLNQIVFANNQGLLKNILVELKNKKIEYAQKHDHENVTLFKNNDYGINTNKAVRERKNIEDVTSRMSLYETKQLSNFQEVMPAAATTNATLGVVRLWQREPGVASPNSACGPTVGVMIANYYKNVKGYSSVNNSTYYGGHAKFINHMYYMMNSHALGTNQYSFHNGLQTQLNLNKNLFTAKSRGYASGVEEPSFANIVNAIDKHYPLALIDYYSFSDEVYHWTIIAGYNQNGQIGYYDPDGGETNRSMKWVNWSTLIDKVGYTYLALN